MLLPTTVDQRVTGGQWLELGETGVRLTPPRAVRLHDAVPYFDRAEAFATYLYGGTYEYTYIARATTPGEFVVPPTRAEEIYAPEVFGRSGSATSSRWGRRAAK